MSRATRKYEATNLMELYAQEDHKGWNEYLFMALASSNINELSRMRYSLQAGMADLETIKMNDEKMSIFYLRLLKSVENTAKQIVRRLHPMPHDAVNLYNGLQTERPVSALEAKRNRDKELEKFFTDSSF